MSVSISVPVELPTPDRIEQIMREEFRAVAEKRGAWLTLQEAAEHVRMPFRTFERKKKLLGIPVSKIDGVQRIWRDDLDAAMRTHLIVPSGAVIEYPSQVLRAAEQKLSERNAA